MYVDIWDIEIITHAAAAVAGERDTADKGEGGRGIRDYKGHRIHEQPDDIV